MNAEVLSWAHQYVPIFNELSAKYHTTYYTQSPLTETSQVGLMVIGINPSGAFGNGISNHTPESFCQGNQCWSKRFNPDGSMGKAMGRFFDDGRFFLGVKGNKTDLPIDDDRQTVWTNLTPFESKNGFSGKFPEELKKVGVESLLELIAILKPRRIVLFGNSAFEELQKYSSVGNKIEHLQVVDNLPLQIGRINDAPAVCVNHPSARPWVVSNKFIPVFIFLHSLSDHATNGKPRSLEAVRESMRHEINLWLTRITINDLSK